MNDFPSRETVERYKKQYPAGTTVMLDAMPDDPYPVPAGTLGTVTAVDDAGQVHIRWRNGRSLAVIPGHDSFHIVQPEQDFVSQLAERLEQNLSEYRAAWLHKSPEQLIGMADVICAVCMTAEHLPNSVNLQQAEHLLHFKNPLEVMSDCWRETHLTDDVFQQEEFSICVENITEGLNDASEYELENEQDETEEMEVKLT